MLPIKVNTVVGCDDALALWIHFSFISVSLNILVLSFKFRSTQTCDNKQEFENHPLFFFFIAEII